jgi:hypothetical protein
MMKTGCIPIFSTDGLKLYFYALTAHFGHWTSPEGARKPVWEIAGELVYGQVKKIHRRRKLVRVERHMLCGELEKLKAGLKEMGLSGRINTAFIERINLTIRERISFLTPRTWGTARFTPELEISLEWCRDTIIFPGFMKACGLSSCNPCNVKASALPGAIVVGPQPWQPD